MSPEAPGPPRGDSIGSAVLAAAARGFAAFAIVTAVGVAIGLAEYAATNGAYRLWTWIKVGFLYLLSFCGVGLHVESTAFPSLGGHDLGLRLPMMAGTGLVVWLLFRAGRSTAERTRNLDPGARALAILSTALAFAIPALLASLPATLRFPDLGATIAPVRWEAALLPLGLALSVAVAGGVGSWWVAPRDEPPRMERVTAMIRGGWKMFIAALLLAFIGFLILAAMKPGPTGAYARVVRDAGRSGTVAIAHHALLLPNQSIWLLGPAMGGSTQVGILLPGESPTTITLSGIDGGPLGRFLYPSEAFNEHNRLALGGGFYLFLLVPLGATLLGGRRAAEGPLPMGERALRGAGAGVVFGVLMAVGAWFSATMFPLPVPVDIPGALPASIYATMPSTAVLALIWGVVGGVLGALSSRWPASTEPVVGDQELAEPA